MPPSSPPQPQTLPDAHGDLGTLSQIGLALFYTLAGDPEQIAIISDSQLASRTQLTSFQHFLTKNNKNLRPVGEGKPLRTVGEGRTKTLARKSAEVAVG